MAAMDGRTAWRAFPLRVNAAEIACAGVILVYALGIRNFDAMIDARAVDAAAAPVAIRAAAEFRAAKARCDALPDGLKDNCRREPRAGVAEPGPRAPVVDPPAFAGASGR